MLDRWINYHYQKNNKSMTSNLTIVHQLCFMIHLVPCCKFQPEKRNRYRWRRREWAGVPIRSQLTKIMQSKFLQKHATAIRTCLHHMQILDNTSSPPALLCCTHMVSRRHNTATYISNCSRTTYRVFGLRNRTVNRPSGPSSEPNPLVWFEEWNELVYHQLISHKQKSSTKWGIVSSHQIWGMIPWWTNPSLDEVIPQTNIPKGNRKIKRT